MNVLIPLWPVEPYEDAVTGENCDCSISTSEVVLPGLRIGSGIPNAPRLFLTCDTDRSRNSLSVFHSSLITRTHFCLVLVDHLLLATTDRRRII